MSSIHIGGNKKSRLYLGDTKIKKGYLGAVKVYSSGNIVTYKLDKNTSYQEEVDYEASCLSPSSFTPSLTGYSFIGWREDDQANASVLSTKTMGDDPITLYAVFRKTITLTLYNNSKTESKLTGYYYYNNGNTAVPQFSQSANTKSGWTFVGWSASSSANGTIVYSTLNKTSINSDITLYGIYQKNITLTYYNNSTSGVKDTKTAYYNSSDTYSYPSFTKQAAVKDNWTFRGWAITTDAKADVMYTVINNNTFNADVSLYATYYRTVYLYYGIDSSNYEEQNNYSSDYCYYNSSNQTKSATFIVKENMFTKTGYKFLNWQSVDGKKTFKANDELKMDGSIETYTIVAVWEIVKTATPYTFIDGSNVYSNYGILEPYIYLGGSTWNKQRVLGNPGTTGAWREVYYQYGALDMNKIMHHYRHIDYDPAAGEGVIYSENPNSCTVQYHTCHSLPSDSIYLKYYISGYKGDNSGFYVQRVDNDSLLKFVSDGYNEGSNYDTLYYFFENVPRNGCSKIKVRVEYVEGGVTIQGKTITEGYKEYEFNVDTTKDTTTIAIETQSNGGLSELRIKYIKFIE